MRQQATDELDDLLPTGFAKRENAAGPTDKAHPYNFIWGRLLDASRRQYQP